MQITRIDDAADHRLDDYRSLTDVALRRRSEPDGGLYMAESAKVIARAVQAGHRPRSVLTQPKWLDAVEQALAGRSADVDVYVASAEVSEQVAGFAIHRGPLAAMHRPELPTVAEVLSRARADRVRIAVLEGLADHMNVGAVFRSAAALGVDAVLVSPDCADPLYRRSVRVSMGTVFQVPWTRIPAWPDGIRELQDAGCTVAGMTLGEGAIELDELVAEDHERLALVLGTEGDGIRPETERLLDRRVTIPMSGGVDSLNVAAASAVAFYATR
ncbi:RNA methyltransferase [Microbacterium sp. ARD32]|uniref:TrmH family RNA methyltransferase n=1 Tax=Microbacterium sp. ARD32 TaxID=2962577 RepID=UPI002881E09B|nr:RNA methyltransferase [Microbacterium sp. ARD32]MDT0157115.1 RNA methyltransferase [Microbacterium sp. ARD32]